MFSPEEEKEQIEKAADVLATSCYFGFNLDEYIEKIEVLYDDHLMNYLIGVINKMSTMGWDLDKVQRFARHHYSVCSEESLRLLDKLADHFDLYVMCIPPDNRFIDGGKLDTALASYSKEEDAALNENIDKLIESIHKRRAMIKIVKEKIEKLDWFEKNLKALRAKTQQ